MDILSLIKLNKANTDILNLKNSQLNSYTITNLITNGRFANSSYTYSILTGAPTVSNGIATCTVSAQNGYIALTSTTGIVTGHKYYSSAKVNSTSSSLRVAFYNNIATPYGFKNHSSTTGWERLSFISTLTDTPTSLSIRIFAQSVSVGTFSVTDVVLIDLTAAFGVGNEPSLSAFETMLAAYNNSQYWFDGNITVSTPKNTDVTSGLPLYVNRTGDVVNVIHRYNDTKDMRVVLQKRGGNNIFEFTTFYLIDNITKITSSDITQGTQFHQGGSDWHGPYQVAADDTTGGDNSSQHFTGGNHVYNQTDNSGTATGRTTSVSMWIDGRKVNDFAGYASNIRLTWVNRIQAYNTKNVGGTGREVLEETITMIFDGVKWQNQVFIKALEGLTVKLYYGLQATLLTSWDGDVFYHSSALNRTWNAVSGTVATNSGTNGKCSRITAKKVSDCLEMGIDYNVGLGDRALITSSYHGQCSTSKKIYFNLINTDIHLATNDTLCYEGYYKVYSL